MGKFFQNMEKLIGDKKINLLPCFYDIIKKIM